MAYPHDKISWKNAQSPLIVSELEAIFNALPDEELLNALTGPRRRGKLGYSGAVILSATPSVCPPFPPS